MQRLLTLQMNTVVYTSFCVKATHGKLTVIIYLACESCRDSLLQTISWLLRQYFHDLLEKIWCSPDGSVSSIDCCPLVPLKLG